MPLFPLNLVVYPGEFLNLHIFEPRYISLISDCVKSNSTFGIPSYVMTKIELGTEMEIMGIEKTYDDGRMDIKTRGLSVLKVVKFNNPWKEKPYAGGEVQYVHNDINIDQQKQQEMVELAGSFFKLIDATGSVPLGKHTSTFDIGHKIGLKREEEYALLGIETEEKRANFVIDHLKKMVDSMQSASAARQIILMNGHFKNLDPLKF